MTKPAHKAMIGLLLRAWRAHEQIGVREASRRIGISPATLSRIENGNNVDGNTMLRLMAWLHGL